MAHRRALRLVCTLVATSLASATLLAQGTPQQPAPAGALRFAVASVEPSEGPATEGTLSALTASFLGQLEVLPGDRFEADTTLRKLIEFAYGFERRWDRARGSDPLLDRWLVVSARGAVGSFDAATPDDLPAVRHMLQQLLIERFGLGVSIQEETRRAMVLRRSTPNRFGPALRPIPGGCADTRADADALSLAQCKWGQNGGSFKLVLKDFDRFVEWVSKSSQQDVIDETGFVGAFRIETAFDPPTIIRMPEPPPNLPAGFTWGQGHYVNLPSFTTAMRDDLGLAVDYEDRPARVLTITHVEP